MKVTVRDSADMASLHQKANVKVKEISVMFPQYSTATIYRHCKRHIGKDVPIDRRKFNRGRPSILKERDRRAIARVIPKLRKTEGSFTSPRIAVEAGLIGKVHPRSITRELNRAGYHYRRSRKKGLLREPDLKARLSFCRKIRKLKLKQNFWNDSIALYIDGKGFQYKTKPLDQARAPSAREWRLKNEGLKPGCTAKGSKEGCINANFMVGISYGRGVVLCEHYTKSITGEKMENIILTAMPEALEKSVDPVGRRILMDGCPRQNSRRSLNAIASIDGMVFKIPARSPDLNPIENFFGMVTKTLRKQVKDRNIERESFSEFVERVRTTMLNYSADKIDAIIKSMDKRIGMVIAAKGGRTKY